MLVTTHDPRADWHALMVDRPTTSALTPYEQALLDTLPEGAREAPLEWICASRVERRGHFDRDEQSEIFTDHTVVTGWLDTPDPRVEHARAISLHGIEDVPLGFLASFPGVDRLGAGIVALTLPGNLLVRGDLERIGWSRPWTDLSLWGSRIPHGLRGDVVRELAEHFPWLLGLEIHSMDLDRTDLEQLARASFLGELQDLTISGRMLDSRGALAVVARLGELVHLDLRDARIEREVVTALAPKLRRARRVVLSGNAIGDAGLDAMLERGAFESVEDLWLSGCELGDASARELASASLPKLRGLWLDSNAFTDDGVAELVDAPFFERLEGLSLGSRRIGDRSRALLAGHPLENALTSTTRLPGVQALWFMGRVAGRAGTG